MKKLSIIIPVYNSGKFLERSINSLLNQNLPLSEYEIIIINDGSTDNSLEIANQFLNDYKNVAVISQENMGMSGARNTGIKNAHGKYIWFVDSDDYIEENCLNLLISEAEKFSVDVYAFLINVKKLSSITIGAKQPLKINEVMTGKKALLLGFIPSSSCCYLFNKEFIISKQLSFTLGITHEDVELIIRVMILANKVVFTNHKPYYYDYNPSSQSKSNLPELQRKDLLDNIVLASLIREIACIQNDKELEQCLLKRSNSIVFGLLCSVIKDKGKHRNINEIIQLAKKEKLYPIHKPLLSWKSSALASLLNFEWIVRVMCKN